MRKGQEKEQEPKYQVIIKNPSAFAHNMAAQRQLACWLVNFGIEHGIIKGCDNLQNKEEIWRKIRRGI